jgi:serine/threonine protein kinase
MRSSAREVALKVVATPDPASGLSTRLQLEARLLARLEHPNLVPVHDAGTLPDGRVYYVMKLVRGTRLDAWRRQGPAERRPCGSSGRSVRPSPSRTRTVSSIAILKPENVMVGAFGEALVMDWGAAKVLGHVHGGEGAMAVDTPGTVIGTPGYMAPEQERGETDHLDGRADIYSSARSCASSFTSRRPTPRPARARVDPSQGHGRAGADRYPTALDLAADVDRFLDGLPVQAHPENLLERSGRLLSRHRTLVALVLAYLLMRAAILVLLGR